MRIFKGTIAVMEDGEMTCIKPHHEELVRECYAHGIRVTPIKFIRVEYNLGLKEAKDICDSVAILKTSGC